MCPQDILQVTDTDTDTDTETSTPEFISDFTICFHDQICEE